MDGDRLYEAGIGMCNGCGKPANIFLLAETQSIADTLIPKGDGLCGECMCQNILETHGYIITKE